MHLMLQKLMLVKSTAWNLTKKLRFKGVSADSYVSKKSTMARPSTSQAIVPILSYNTVEINIYMKGSEKSTSLNFLTLNLSKKPLWTFCLEWLFCCVKINVPDQ